MPVLKKITVIATGMLFTQIILGCNSNPVSSDQSSQSNDLDKQVADSSVAITPKGLARNRSSVRIGVLMIDSALSVYKRYTPLTKYLSQQLDRPVELVPLNQSDQFMAVENQEIDFIVSNPLAAVQIQRLYQTKFLVTHSRPSSGTQFSGLIITRAGSDIQALGDLRGKKVACVNFQTAAAGCLFQILHLLQHNIDPFSDFGAFIENPSQDNIVLAVLNGTIDAGFIRTGQLEKMKRNGLIPNLEGIQILEPVNDDFEYTHTTELYPEWPIAALPSTEPALSQSVQSALLSLPENHPSIAAANIERFVESVDYKAIHDLIESLRLKSWDAQPM